MNTRYVWLVFLFATWVTLFGTHGAILYAFPQIKLTASDGAGGDEFGGSVDIDGILAIVGARFDDDAGSQSGAAYLFNSHTGQQVDKLTANDSAAEDWFGISVGLSGSFAVIGSYQDDPRGNNSGSVYVFDATTGTQLRKLVPTDGSADDNFGISVSVDGAFTVVGAYRDNGKGSAYVFNVATGQQIHKFAPLDLASSAYFGGAVAISGNLVVVGANSDDEAGPFAGSAYIFDVATGNQLHKLTPNDGGPGKQFGMSVAIDGANVIVGNVDGSAYVFDALTGSQKFKLSPPNLVTIEKINLNVAVTGNKALIGVAYDDSVASGAGAAYLYDIGTGQLLHQLAAFDAEAGDQFGSSIGADNSRVIVGAWGVDVPLSRMGAAYLITVPEPLTLAILMLNLACVVASRGHFFG